MSEPRYYIRKGNKAVGPLTLPRLRELLDQGMLQTDSIIGQSAKGPWLPLSDILEAETPAPEQPSLPPQSIPAPMSPDFSAIDFSATPINTTAGSNTAGNTSSYWEQASVKQPIRKVSNKAKLEESSDTPVYIRAFAPWVGENDRGRYGNLKRYIEIYRSVSIISFVLGFIAISVLFLASLGISVSVLLDDLTSIAVNTGSSKVQLIFMWMLRSFALMASYLLGFLFLHLIYIVSMACIDFLRLMIDVEGNTREVANYARSESNS